MMHDDDLDLIREGVAAARGDTTPSLADAQRSLERMHVRMGEGEVDVQGYGRRGRAWPARGVGREVGIRTLRGWGLRVVTLALVIVGGIAVLTHRGDEGYPDLAHVYATQTHQQASVTLGDGTHVTLAPQTRLRVGYIGALARTVTLERGEAYFEVVRATTIPFAVHSGTTTTQVLGTAFMIRYEPRDPYVRVAVTDGKVRVIASARSASGVAVAAGQVGEVTDSTVHVSTVDDLAPGTEWAPGRIMFRDTPVATVLQTVSRWYGYQFRYTDQSLPTRSVTMIVSTRSSVEALAEIERILAVNLTVVGDTVTLVPQPLRASRSTPRIRTYDVWSPTREVGR